MRGHFKDPVKDQGSAFEENVAPIPAIVFDDAMCLRFDPYVE
jgi:hypothetical protein